MRELNRQILFFGFSFSFIGCISHPSKEFTRQDLMIANTFRKKNTVVYVSQKGQRDTIMFFPVTVDTIKRRSFELGFYDAYVMEVDYELTHGSFHALKDTTGSLTLYSTVPEVFYIVNISTKEYSGKRMSFLGVRLKDFALDSVLMAPAKIIDFKCHELVPDRGVVSFKFNHRDGVVSYVDVDAVKWFREAQW